jgi:hypothetical protein
MNFKAVFGFLQKWNVHQPVKKNKLFTDTAVNAKQFFSSTEKSLRSEVAGFDCRGSHISML